MNWENALTILVLGLISVGMVWIILKFLETTKNRVKYIRDCPMCDWSLSDYDLEFVNAEYKRHVKSKHKLNPRR